MMMTAARTTRPSTTALEQATTLLNWMLFTHMIAELQRELRLAISWRNGYGASILNVDWKQVRRMDYIDVNLMGLQEFVHEPAVAQFIGGSGNQIPKNSCGMIGTAGNPSTRASALRSVSEGYCSSAPITATGTIGDCVSSAKRMKPGPNGASL